MSAGNSAAAIGLANTNKIVNIGAYVQDVGELLVAGPSALNNYAGVNGVAYYDRNVLGEDIGFSPAANSGVAAGKLAVWVQLGAPGIVPGANRVNVVDGVATANVSGTHDIFVAQPVVTVPVGTYCWAFER